MSNLKQIGLGMTQYTQDYDEHYPQGNWVYPGNTVNASTNVPWEIVIQPYLKSSQIFDCPSSTIAKYSLTSPSTAASVGYNFWLAFPSASAPIHSLALSAFKTPSETLMLADGEEYMIRGISHTNANVFKIGNGTTRHLEGGNICFYDGHVKWLPGSKIPLLPDGKANIGDLSSLPNSADAYTFWVGQ
jgi:prepilin-type processing-associated H-X9-DG protein